MNLVIFGYRGYGKSEGTPSEEGVYLDGLAMAKYVFEDQEAEKYIDRENVFLFGKSFEAIISLLSKDETKYDYYVFDSFFDVKERA